MAATLSATSGISVYADAAGTQLLFGPGGSQTWTAMGDIPSKVYVAGVNPGSATLTWTLCAQGNTIGSDSVNYTVAQLQLYMTDGENQEPVPIDPGAGAVPVKVGETIVLTALRGGGYAAADWAFPGNGETIQAYNPSAANNQLTQLGVPGVGVDANWQVVSNSSSVSFEFVAGGNFTVTATVGNARVTATFSVDAPRGVAATATMTKTLIGKSPILGYGTCDVAGAGSDLLSMVPLAFSANTPAGWQYCFAQTITAFSAFTVPDPPPPGTLSAGTFVTFPPYSGLDRTFPYHSDPKATGVFGPSPSGAWDCDGPRVAAFYEGTSFLCFTATTYYMCQPVVNGVVVGGWVPLASVTWSYVVAADWWIGKPAPAVLWSSVLVSGVAPTYEKAYWFQQTTGFPEWSQTVAPQMVNLRTGEIIGG